MPTIRDVAARAGVSVSTVSRVLNQSGYADADTRARVRKAAAALNYQPNANWSRLRSQSSHTILYLLANRDNINSFHMRLLVSCERTLQARGYDLTFSRYEYTRSLAPADLPLPRMLEKSGAVDGILLAGVHHPNLLQLLDKRRIPHVMLGNDFDGPPAQLARNCVFFDDGAGIADAVDHLVRLGHRRIAFVGNVEFPWFRRRFQAFASTMDRHGLAPAAVTAHWPVVNTEYGQLAAAQLLRADATPTAIVAGNDELAAGVWKELTRRGIAIPRQVSLIGCGDRPEFNILEPELSSIAVFVDQLGERLTAMLLRRIENPKQSAPSETYPCKLVERASCAPPL